MSKLYPLRRLIWRGTETLTTAGIENAQKEAVWIAEHALQITQQDLINDPEKLVSGPAYLSIIRRRASGEPLQYLLGTQDFMGMELKVGKGVLIPRPETEVLCRVGAELVNKSNPLILDLCAGTGCVGLGLQKLLPQAEIIAVEKYAAAMRYLEMNTQAFGRNFKLVKADVLVSNLSDLPPVDLIVSNPPYIEQGTLSALQKEVLREPKTALDGGADGLDFYRRIAAMAKDRLKPDGALAVEIGATQTGEVKMIFAKAGIGDIGVARDDADLDRVVYGRISN